MALEDLTGTKYLDDLVATNPAAGDNVSDGDDHIRGIKNVLKTTFPSIDGAITATDTELNYVDGVTSAIQTQLDFPVAKGDGSSQDGYIQLNCSQNSHGIKLKSPPHSANASYTLTFPNDDGTNGQKLTTNGSGVLTWAADVDTVYTHPNHSGEVTSSSDGATVVADNVIDEANLKISNSPSNGYVLTAQSGNTGGMTWATAPSTNATHTGEVTGATTLTIADNIVDEANLKVSNAPTNGYVLTAQSGASGGLTWAAASSSTTNPILAFVASSGSIDNIEGNSYNTMPFFTAAGTIDVLPLNILTSGNTFPFFRADGTADTIGVT